MSQMLLSFIIKHISTTTLVSTFTLVLTLYKFSLSCKKQKQSKNCHDARSNQLKATALICKKLGLRSSNKYRDQNEAFNTLMQQTPITGILKVLNGLTDLRLDSKLRDFQDHLANARRILKALDQWLESTQYKIYSLQSRLSGRQGSGENVLKPASSSPRKTTIWSPRRRVCSGQ